MFSRKASTLSSKPAPGTSSATPAGGASEGKPSMEDLMSVFQSSGGIASALVSPIVQKETKRERRTKEEQKEREKAQPQQQDVSRGAEQPERKVSRARFFGYVKEEADRARRKAPPEKALFLIHGWADSIEQWERMRGILEQDLGYPVYLFAYKSLDNRATVENLAVNFDVFVRERLKVLQKRRDGYVWQLIKQKFTDKYRDINGSVSLISATPEQIENLIAELEGLDRELTAAEDTLPPGREEDMQRQHGRLRARINELRNWVAMVKEEQACGGDSASCSVEEVKKKKVRMLEQLEVNSKKRLEEEDKEDEEDQKEDEREEEELKQLDDKSKANLQAVSLKGWLNTAVTNTLDVSGDFTRAVAVHVVPPTVPGGGPSLTIMDEKKNMLYKINDTNLVLPSVESPLRFLLKIVSKAPEGEQVQEVETSVGLAFASSEDSEAFTEKFFQPPPEEPVSGAAPDDRKSSEGEKEPEGAAPAWSPSPRPAGSEGAGGGGSRTELLGSRAYLQSLEEAQEEARKRKEAAQPQKKQKQQTERVKIDILVYSTGGLILRYFLKLYYWKSYQGIIDHVAMCAPANYGSPWARKGKEGIGRIWVGDKSFSNFLGTGSGLLTSLECPSPFLWELARSDSILSRIGNRQQYFHPDFIKTAVFQGGADYSGTKGLTRGDMFGSDGTVTITGAGLRIVAHEIHLSELGKQQSYEVQRSSGDLAFRILDQYNHATIKLGIEEKQETFNLLKEFFSTKDANEFYRFQEAQRKANDELVASGFNPGKLVVFRFEGTAWSPLSKTDRPPLIQFAIFPLTGVDPAAIHFGWEIDMHAAAVLPAQIAPVAAETLKTMSNFRRHSVDKRLIYAILNPTDISEQMQRIAKFLDIPVGVFVYLEGRGHYKLLGCTLWEGVFGKHLGSYDHIALFSIF